VSEDSYLRFCPCFYFSFSFRSDGTGPLPTSIPQYIGFHDPAIGGCICRYVRITSDGWCSEPWLHSSCTVSKCRPANVLYTGCSQPITIFYIINIVGQDKEHFDWSRLRTGEGRCRPGGDHDVSFSCINCSLRSLA